MWEELGFWVGVAAAAILVTAIAHRTGVLPKGVKIGAVIDFVLMRRKGVTK